MSLNCSLCLILSGFYLKTKASSEYHTQCRICRLPWHFQQINENCSEHMQPLLHVSLRTASIMRNSVFCAICASPPAPSGASWGFACALNVAVYSETFGGYLSRWTAPWPIPIQRKSGFSAPGNRWPDLAAHMCHDLGTLFTALSDWQLVTVLWHFSV